MGGGKAKSENLTSVARKGRSAEILEDHNLEDTSRKEGSLEKLVGKKERDEKGELHYREPQTR